MDEDFFDRLKDLTDDVELDDESDKAVLDSTAQGHRRFVDDDLGKDEWEVTPQKFRAGVPTAIKNLLLHRLSSLIRGPIRFKDISKNFPLKLAYNSPWFKVI